MSFRFNNETPIYLQIIEHIRMQIISREYLPNDRLPSVRELSLAFEVNPNTVQKALAELENKGLIYTERTNGKFVTNDEKIITAEKEKVINSIINDFYKSMDKIGLNKTEIIKLLNEKEL